MLQQGEDGGWGLFILLVFIPAWTPEHQIPVPLVSLAWLEPGTGYTALESACFPSDCTPLPPWCLASAPLS